MLQKLRVLALGVAVCTSIWPTTCEAYVRRLRFPLAGCRDYPLGKGNVTFAQSFESTGAGTGTLTIDVNNVPLPPGTVLEVIVHDRQVGTLKLDKERNGRLVLVSTSKQGIPQLTEGSIVAVKLPSGPRVLW